MSAGIVAPSTHDLLPGLNPLVPNLPLEVAEKLAVAQESRTSGAKARRILITYGTTKVVP
jgi:hypothetical protein